MGLTYPSETRGLFTGRYGINATVNVEQGVDMRYMPSFGNYPCEARGSCNKHTQLSELECVEHGICMM